MLVMDLSEVGERLDRLEQVASEVIEDGFTAIRGIFGLSLFVSEVGGMSDFYINIREDNNVVRVYHKDNLEVAQKLASEYNELVGQFEVVKDYE